MPDNKEPQFQKENVKEASEQLRLIMGEIAKFNTTWERGSFLTGLCGLIN